MISFLGALMVLFLLQSDSASESSDECTSDCSEHSLVEQTFTSQQKCHKCNKHLTTERQGLQCTGE